MFTVYIIGRIQKIVHEIILSMLIAPTIIISLYYNPTFSLSQNRLNLNYSVVLFIKFKTNTYYIFIFEMSPPHVVGA